MLERSVTGRKVIFAVGFSDWRSVVIEVAAVAFLGKRGLGGTGRTREGLGCGTGQQSRFAVSRSSWCMLS